VQKLICVKKAYRVTYLNNHLKSVNMRPSCNYISLYQQARWGPGWGSWVQC